MLVVETVARIRREFFVKGKSIKEIVRDLGESRNTVRKVLRSGETGFAYERSVQPLPKLGPWASELDGLLEANGSKARRERLTMIRIFEELQGLGYRGGYDAVRRYAASWHRDRSAATMSAQIASSSRLEADAVQRQSQSGEPWATDSVAISLAEDGDTPPQWFGVVAFGHTVKTQCRQARGVLVSIGGRLQLNRYRDRDGKVRQQMQVMADTVISVRTARQGRGKR